MVQIITGKVFLSFGLVPRSSITVHIYRSKSRLGPRRLGRLRPTDYVRFRLKSSTLGFNAPFCIASYRDRSLSISLSLFSCVVLPKSDKPVPQSPAFFEVPKYQGVLFGAATNKGAVCLGLVLRLDASTPP